MYSLLICKKIIDNIIPILLLNDTNATLDLCIINFLFNQVILFNLEFFSNNINDSIEEAITKLLSCSIILYGLKYRYSFMNHVITSNNHNNVMILFQLLEEKIDNIFSSLFKINIDICTESLIKVIQKD